MNQLFFLKNKGGEGVTGHDSAAFLIKISTYSESFRRFPWQMVLLSEGSSFPPPPRNKLHGSSPSGRRVNRIAYCTHRWQNTTAPWRWTVGAPPLSRPCRRAWRSDPRAPDFWSWFVQRTPPSNPRQSFQENECWQWPNRGWKISPFLGQRQRIVLRGWSLISWPHPCRCSFWMLFWSNTMSVCKSAVLARK